MALSCVYGPTLTSTQVSTSQSLVTTSTESISTGPSSVSTVVLRTCSQPSGVSSRCRDPITTFITLPGATTTITVPATVTVDVPMTVVTTLFGSPCASRTPSPDLRSRSRLSSSPRASSTTSTHFPVVTTPPPTIITTSSLVTADGSTFFSLFTSTLTHAATTLNAQSTGATSDNGTTPGPIVGGIIGGLTAFLFLGLLTWRLIKKRSKFNRQHLFHPVENGRRNQTALQKTTPLEKPSYQYGVVGQQASNPVTLSPSRSSLAAQNVSGNEGSTGDASGPLDTSGNDAGLPQSTAQAIISNDERLGQIDNGQVLIGNVMGQAFGSPGTLGTNGDLGRTVSSGRVVRPLPPIKNIGDPSLIPLIARRLTTASTTPSSRPSSSRPSTGSSSQPIGPFVTPVPSEGSYSPTLRNWNASHGFGQHVGPSTPSNNNNNGDGPGPGDSTASTPSAYSHSSWLEDHQPPPLPSLPSPLPNSFGRVPTLQVTNNSDYEYQPYAEMGSLSFPKAAAVAGPSSQEAPSYDGRGRPSNMPPEKTPLVHLDGTLYQQSSGGDPASGNAPPGYIE